MPTAKSVTGVMNICTKLPDPSEAVCVGKEEWLGMDKRAAISLRYAVGVFAGGRELTLAYRELTENGFLPEDLCVMATGSTVASHLGIGGPLLSQDAELSKDESRSLRELMKAMQPTGAFCVAGPVHASNGAICGYIDRGNDAALQGDWFSDVLGVWIAKRSAQYLEDRLGEGKILIWAMTGDRTGSRREHLACDILLRHASESVRVLDFTPIY